jgi:uncharacterized membrane protein
MAYARPRRQAKVSAAMLAFSPVTPMVLYLAWTETQVIFCLALVWFCHCRKSRFLPYAFGLLLASKQYMPALAPLGLLLLPRPWSLRDTARFGLRAAAVGAVVTLPFVLWNPHAFYHSVVQWQMIQPFRPDALSFLVWAHPADPSKWLWLPFALLGLMLLVCLRIGYKRTLSFPLAVALCLLPFFATNKQAFANYYYLVIASFLLAVTSPTEIECSRQ